MKKVWNSYSVIALGLIVAGLMMAGAPESVEARPKYLGQFRKNYKNMGALAKKEKCLVCHYGKKKKNRNDYGKALTKHLGKLPKKGEMDKKKIDTALEKTEKDKSSVEGKTFGDLIKDGKLPGTAPKEEAKK